MFAISFAFISVAVGSFGTYDDVLKNAGPVGNMALGHRGGRATLGGAGDRAVRACIPLSGVAENSPDYFAIGGGLMLAILIGMTPKTSASSSPVAAILRDQLGPVTERTLLVAIVFAFFGAGMVT